MARIVAVCRSDKKGISKDAIDEGLFLENYGLEDDAHASSEWHRQVSLLAVSSLDKMRKMGLDLNSGALAENLTVEGMDLVSLPVGTRLAVGDDIVLEVTQIGKECHTGCAIFRKVGTCIMPTDGIFARVIQGGKARAGDEIRVVENQA